MYLPLNIDFLQPLSIPTQRYSVDSIHEQGSGESNEDRLLLGDGIYGVFDGATSLGSKERFDGLSGGAMAAHIAKDTFLHTEENLYDAALEANRRLAIAQVSAGKDLSSRDSLWSTSMAVVRIDGNQLEYCQTGDSLIMLMYKDGSHGLITPEVDIDRETMMLWQTLSAREQKETGSIYTSLGAQIRKVRLEMNRSYGVLNGEPEAAGFLAHGNISLSSVTDILIFTDGLYLPKKDPSQQSDWATYTRLYKEKGLAGLKDWVKSLQSSDPSLNVYPRFKIHDDMAAVSLSFTS